ncbi:hypothetical protein [Vibrio atypicus]|jgi:hypothetical protein|uniref:hypothetical protein n=1 Tax=Vibrio atypicus TaxID=558271 RepID=UPI001359C334|nr:hypothetical protein [Vibrio atypicus]
MITVHRNYQLQDANHFHAHVEINPIGQLDVDIIENKQHHQAEFEELKFEKTSKHTRLCATHGKQRWQVALDDKDAKELDRLIREANEEFETLMRDL